MPRIHNTDFCQNIVRPIETTQKIWYSVGSGHAAGSAWVLSKPGLRSFLDVHSRK